MKPSLLLLLIAVLVPAACRAQVALPKVESLDETGASKVVFLNPDYLAHHPQTVDPAARLPLVIYLHGAGGVGDDATKNTARVRAVVEGIRRFEKGPCLVVAPQCRRESPKSDERGTWEPEDLDLFLEHLLATYPYIDRDRIYLTGNSMGGYGCWVWGGHSPEHFAAIAPIVGGIGRGGPKDVTPDLEAWAANLAKVPVWAFAGAEDKVVPAERSERMIAAIQEAGGTQARILVYAEEGHGASRQVYNSQAFFDWMFSQKRGAESEGEVERAERREAALELIDLRIKPEGWGNASAKDLSAVLHSCCGELAVHFARAHLQALEPIRIRHDEAGPITHYQRTVRGEIVVLLDSKNRFWCQHAYQMAHEFGHILCRTRKGDRTNLWFEESLCELASIFALRQMATSWKTAPPYPNWKGYAEELGKYSDDLIEKYTLPDDVTLQAFYEAHAETLSTEATDRDLNGKVAVRLLALFENAPLNWRAVYYLNAGKSNEKQTFEAYLRSWQQHCPAEHRAFVVQVAEAFGLSL